MMGTKHAYGMRGTKYTKHKAHSIHGTMNTKYRSYVTQRQSIHTRKLKGITIVKLE